MKIWTPTIFACLILTTFTSCAVGRWFGKNPGRSPSYEEVKYAEVEESVALRELFATLPKEVTDCFDDDFFVTLSRRFSGAKEQQIELILRRQLTRDPDAMPFIPDFTMPLRHESVYDSFVSSYQLRTPQDGDGPLVLLFGELNTPLEQLSYSRSDWLLHIPSRPGLNYQLVAEGDAWHALNDVYRLYPELKKRPVYLVGLGDGGDAALYFANHYRSRFAGVAFSESRLGFDLPNLDRFPTVHFGNSHASSPWGNKRLIALLQERGNTNAKSISGGIDDAVSALTTSRPPPIAPFTFTDYNDANAYRWLRVLGKKSEKEPVTIKGHFNGDELVLEAPNASSVEIQSSLPKGVSRVRFNGQIFAFNAAKTAILGDEEVPYSAHKKVDTPAAFKNFFCKEPVYIVYQDKASDDLYLENVKNFADAIAKLKIVGFPAVDVNLPTVPLSQYIPDNLPDHRAIFIGTPEKLSRQLTNEPSYYPVNFSRGGVKVLYRQLPLAKNGFDAVAYGLTYPPEKPSPLKLALLLCADNDKGLQILSQHYLSATTLYRSSDLRLWLQEDQQYSLAAEYTFDSYWSGSSFSSAEVSVPPMSASVWEEYLKELIISQSRLATFVIRPVIDERLTPPTVLSASTLAQYIPDRHFAILRTKGTPPAVIKNLMSTIDEVSVSGLPTNSPASTEGVAVILRHKGGIVIDADTLSSLTPQELTKINYQLLPYSLHEMIMNRFTQDREAFGKELIRLGNYIAEK